MQNIAQNIIYLSHGGGPFPLLGEPSHQSMVDQLSGIAASLPVPERILLISAHWEESTFSVTGHPSPGLIYDYYGFPEEAYSITYAAPGDPQFAGTLQESVRAAGIKLSVSPERGFDHGMFVPLKIMFPQADIPVVQLSLSKHLDAAMHVRMGEALAKCDLSKTLVIGSGFSFHNMKAFFKPVAGADEMNDAFQLWLKTLMTDVGIREGERSHQLINWETTAPNARFCHPREEHLLPLHVCYGLAGKPAKQAFQTHIAGKLATTFLW